MWTVFKVEVAVGTGEIHYIHATYRPQLEMSEINLGRITSCKQQAQASKKEYGPALPGVLYGASRA